MTLNIPGFPLLLSQSMQPGFPQIFFSAIFLAGQICLVGGAEPTSLKASRLPPLPETLGVAGPFAGVAEGSLVVAGGANFPNGYPWAGGKKVWHDTIYALAKSNGQWRSIGTLPRPLAYGVSITTTQGVICIGGSDANQHYADCFRLSLRGGKPQFETLPNLPVPLASAASALVGQTIFVAGGAEAPGEKSASANLYALNLSALGDGWKKLSPCPGPARIFPAAAALNGDFYLLSGAMLVTTNAADSRLYLRDAWRFNPATGWQKLPDLPHACTAAPSPAPTADDRFFILGGDDGSTRTFQPIEKHPGFSRSILAFDSVAGAWMERGQANTPRVTTTAVFWQNGFVVPSGEQRPGVRSPEVWSYQMPERENSQKQLK